MKKRILSIVLCLSMALTLLPTAAFATEEPGDPAEPVVQAEPISEPAPLAANTVELDIAGGAIKISPTGYERYKDGKWSGLQTYTGSYVITGTEQGSNPGFDYITVFGLATDATLTLKNLTIGSTKNQSALSLAGKPSVPEVCIEGTVSLGGQETAIKANGALNLTGTGSLALDVVNGYPQGEGQGAAAVISAASVAANLTGDITVSATATNADNPAAIHAIKTTGKVIQFGEGDTTPETTVDGAVSLTSTGGKVSLISSGTTAPLILSAGTVTISGKTGVAVTNAGEMAIIASGHNVSLTSGTGKVDVTSNGNSPAIQAGAVTISGYNDVTVTNAGTGPGISANGGEVSLTSESRVVEVSGKGTAISSGKLTIHGNGRVLVSSTDGQAISTSGVVSLTSDNSNVDVNGNGGTPAISASTLTIAAKDLVTVENGNADNAISTTGDVSLHAADIFVGGLIFASNSTVTFTAPEGAQVISESTDPLIIGTVTVAEGTQLKLIGNAEGIIYAADGSASRTTAYAGDLSGGGEVNTAGTYIAGDGTIAVEKSNDGKYTATMTNATVGGDLNFNDDCTLTLVGQNQFDNQLSLLNNDKYLTLTINGTGELVASKIYADNITINGGTVTADEIYLEEYAGDGAPKQTLSITGGTVNAGSISCKGEETLTITGGTVNAVTIVAENPTIASTAKVNAIVQASGTNSVTVYGNVTLTQDVVDFTSNSTFSVSAGASLTVPSGVKLYLLCCTGKSETAGINAITNSGKMTINGELMLPTAFNSEGAIGALNLTGSGSVLVSDEVDPNTYTPYFTDGSQPHIAKDALTFIESADAGDLAADGYHWDNAGKTLTLKNLWLEVSDGDAISLPDGATLVLQGVSTVIAKSSAIDVNGNLTVSGTDGILKAGGTSSTSGRSIEVTGTLTVDSGTILSAGNYASVKAERIAINDGTIDLGAHGSMTANATLTITGGNVTTGDNEASMLANNIVISGGVVKTGAGIQGSICAADFTDGATRPSITITGGTVIANGGNHPDTRIGICAMNGDISITGGKVSATGMVAAIVALEGTITDTGMTATTPAGGTVKSVTVITQGDTNDPMTVASYTADATLHVDGQGVLTNACTTVSLAKTQTPPVNPPITPPITPPDSGDSGDSDSGSGGGSSGGGTVTPPVPKPEPPKTDPGTGNTEVSVPVKPVTKGDTSSATVPEKSVSDAIAAAEKEAAKTGGSASVTVTVDAPKGAKTVETTLSGKSLSAVADGKTEGLKISTPVADLSFDSEALKNIAGMAGKDVKISATRVDTDNLTDAQKSQVGDAPVFDFTVTSDGKTISNFNGGTATVTVPYTPKEGENPEFVTVWLLDDAGKLIPIEAKYKDGKITFETGHFSRYAIGYLPFTDVKAGWAYESIVYAYQNKLFAGVGGNKFAPTANMNRAMLWTVLYRMAGSPGKTETPANWYADAQAWAIANGISDGTNPDGNITREQLATILFRYAKGAATAADMSGFTDTADISGFAKDGMSWAVERKILQGNSGKLIPKGNATRAQVAAMLQRFAGLSK